MSTRYIRAFQRPDGSLETRFGVIKADNTFELAARSVDEPTDATYAVLQWLFRRGYAIVVADMRGCGASFGTVPHVASRQACEDECDLVEWVARQPWCTGKVGMYGVSFGGMNQYYAAAERPPHLAAMVPVAAPFDTVTGDGYMVGGIARHGWTGAWKRAHEPGFDAHVRATLGEERWAELFPHRPLPGVGTPSPYPIAPVDGPEGADLLAAALDERAGPALADRNRADWAAYLAKVEGRFFTDEQAFADEWLDGGQNNGRLAFERMLGSGVPIYMMGGWYDFFVPDTIQYFLNYDGPKRLLMGNWGHSENEIGAGKSDPRADEYRRMVTTETTRWFDRWLKEEDNGITDEPPVLLATVTADRGWTWHRLAGWPDETAAAETLFLADGTLSEAAPVASSGIPWTPDPATTTGISNRWIRLHPDGDRRGWAYPDMTALDQRGLPFTSDPLPAEMLVLGAPRVTLWIAADRPVVDILALLEVVTAEGRSVYVTEGALRTVYPVDPAPPYRTGGVLLRTITRKAAEDASNRLDAERPKRVEFTLTPTALSVATGQRVRITLLAHDRDNLATLDPTNPPAVAIFVGGATASAIALPLLPTGAT